MRGEGGPVPEPTRGLAAQADAIQNLYYAFEACREIWPHEFETQEKALEFLAEELGIYRSEYM